MKIVSLILSVADLVYQIMFHKRIQRRFDEDMAELRKRFWTDGTD